MKIISWNVNGLRAAEKKGFTEFFLEEDADIFAIQETKMQESQLTDTMKFEGYKMYMNSAERKGYSGTLVYTKKTPISCTYDIEGDDSKVESLLLSMKISILYVLMFLILKKN